MPPRSDLLTRIRAEILALAHRWLFLTFGERSLVGRRLPSGSFVPMRAFAAGEALWLDPQVLDVLPSGTQADVVVCHDRSASAWASSGPPDTSVIARVTIAADGPREAVRLVPSLPHGSFDILLDLRRDGGFNIGDAIQGSRGPGIVVHEDPATTGPYSITREDLDLGPVTIPSGSISGTPREVNIVLTLIKPVGVPLGPLAIIAHGNGYDRRHTNPLGELLASWGISAAVCEHELGSVGRDVQIQALRSRLRTVASGAGLDTRRPVLIGHSAGGGAATLVARDAEIASPLAGLVLLAAAVPGTAPLVATPLLGLVGTRDGYGVFPAPGSLASLPGNSAPWIVEATTSAASLVVVEGGSHGDFTYPVGDADGPAPVVASVGAERRRYVAGMVAAFCRRHLLDQRTLDVYLVDGVVVVPSVDARVASRPGRPFRIRLESGDTISPIVRHAGGGAGWLVDRALVVDCNLAATGRAMWFLATTAGGFVRWGVPLASVAPTDLSIHVAQVADDPGIVSLSSNLFSAARSALDARRVDTNLARALQTVGIEIDGALADNSGPATVLTAGSRWSIRTRGGRTYTLSDAGDGFGFSCMSMNRPNMPRRTITFSIEVADRAGVRERIDLRVSRPTRTEGDPEVSCYTGFRVPLAAFGVDPSDLASVALVANEPCELAIDHVELVTSWD